MKIEEMTLKYTIECRYQLWSLEEMTLEWIVIKTVAIATNIKHVKLFILMDYFPNSHKKNAHNIII